MDNYEEKYKQALAKAKEILEHYRRPEYNEILQYAEEDLVGIFPELKESEDEKIRKEIISYLKTRKGYTEAIKDPWIAWLERQGEQKPNYCHHEVDLSECSEEYRKAYYDGWNNCNMQHSQCKSELDDVVKCLINGMKFYYEANEEATWGTDKWSMSVKHIIEVLEKQGEQKPVPKFKVGDTMRTLQEATDGYTDGMPVVFSIDEEYYNCNNELIAIKDQDDYEYPPMNRRQKPNDKVEPKFRDGDWVVDEDDNYVHQIERVVENVTNDKISYDLVGGGYFPSTKKNYHLWTIQDARCGDVILDGNNPFIFKKTKYNSKHCYAFCGIGQDGHFMVNPYNWYGKEDPSEVWTCGSYLKPATKEQRDLLFQKMKEAGYEWDADELGLREIKQKPAEWTAEDEEELKIALNTLEKAGQYSSAKWLKNVCFVPQTMQKPASFEIPLLEKFKQAVYDCAWGKVTCKSEGETQDEYVERWTEQLLSIVRDWADDYIDYTIQQKLRKSYDKGKEDVIKENSSAWSEEDSKICNAIIKKLGSSDSLSVDLSEAISWVSSVKYRVQPQPNQEWSEEDEDAIAQAIIALEDMYNPDEPERRYAGYTLTFDKAAERLKSLRPQNRWKPSDEQMEELKGVQEGVFRLGILESLYQDLKKLREG